MNSSKPKASLEVSIIVSGEVGTLHYPVAMKDGPRACVVIDSKAECLKVGALQEIAVRTMEVIRLTVCEDINQVYVIQVFGNQRHYALANMRKKSCTLAYLCEEDFIRMTGVEYRPNWLTEKSIAVIGKLIRSTKEVQEQMRQIMVDGVIPAEVSRTYGVSPSAVSQAVRRYQQSNETILGGYRSIDANRHFANRATRSMHFEKE